MKFTELTKSGLEGALRGLSKSKASLAIMVCAGMTSALRAMEREGHSYNPFDFGARLRFDAATVCEKCVGDNIQ